MANAGMSSVFMPTTTVSVSTYLDIKRDDLSDMFLKPGSTFPFMNTSIMKLPNDSDGDNDQTSSGSSKRKKKTGAQLAEEEKIDWQQKLALTHKDVRRMEANKLTSSIPLPSELNKKRKTPDGEAAPVEEKEKVVTQITFNGRVYPEVQVQYEPENDNQRIAFGKIKIDKDAKNTMSVSLDIPEPGRYTMELEGVTLPVSNAVPAKSKTKKRKKLADKQTLSLEDEFWQPVDPEEFTESTDIIQRCFDRMHAAEAHTLNELHHLITIEHDDDQDRNPIDGRTYVHICCDRCSKWRNLPPNYQASLFEGSWFCEMHPSAAVASCHAPSQTQSRFHNQDEFCTVCLGSALDMREGILLPCAGPCLRSFHSKCVNPIKQPDSSKPSDWFCEECLSQQHPCFLCKSVQQPADATSQLPAKCPVSTCSKFYHPICFHGQLTDVIGDSGRPERTKVCPLHVCERCSEPGSVENPLVQCTKCPTAYHRNSRCCPTFVEFVRENAIICPDHRGDHKISHYVKGKMEFRQVHTAEMADQLVDVNPFNVPMTTKTNGKDDNAYGVVQYNRLGDIIFPILLNRECSVLALGEKKPVAKQGSVSHKYPIGFKSVRNDSSLLDPEKKATFVSDIVDGGDSCVFRVRCSEMPDSPFVGHNPTAVWTQVKNKIRQLKAGENLKPPSAKVNGDKLFGLSDPALVDLLQDILDVPDTSMTDKQPAYY